MNDDLEHQLRAALRPVSPRQDLGPRVIDALPALSDRRSKARWWAAAGLAASLLLTVVLQQRATHERAAQQAAQRHSEQQREAESGERARRQVIEALRVTNQKLDLALRAVAEESSS